MSDFGKAITRMINKEDLSYEEMNQCFKLILENKETDMNQGAFLAALSAKGETAEEIRAVWQNIMNCDTVIARPEVDEPIVENSGTGMDTVKTFNISTLAALCACADGVNIARHGSRAITSSCGTVDILEQMGVGVEVSPEIVKKSVEETGIGIFNGMSPLIHPMALGRILSQISFGTVLNTAASLSNPAIPDYAVRGVYNKEMLVPVAQIMQKIGIKKAIVVHGLLKDGKSGIDEASIFGETQYATLNEKGEIKTGLFRPEDLGISIGRIEEIYSLGNAKVEAKRFLSILCGKGSSSQVDIVALNSALILELTGKAKSWQDGYEKSKELLNSQKALAKLKEWILVQNEEKNKAMALEKLEKMIKEI